MTVDLLITVITCLDLQTTRLMLYAKFYLKSKDIKQMLFQKMCLQMFWKSGNLNNFKNVY